jgi:peptidoglycan lytic transglycosylase B
MRSADTGEEHTPMTPRTRPALVSLSVLSVLLFLVAGLAYAGADDETRTYQHGWRYVVDRLVADGISRDHVVAAFADPQIPPFDGLSFQLEPRESRARYRLLLSQASRRAASQCRARYAEAFSTAEAREGVPASLIAAIVHVESSCGRTTGKQPVLHRLARLAMANEPANVADNIRRLAGNPPDPVIADRVRARAAYLENTFYPELRGLFTMAERLGLDPLTVQGSGSGAFGFPQFLPTSYLRYGVDGNGDGRVSLYDMDDAAASCARFLAANGWRRGLTAADQRRVLWQYNRSDAYIDTILALHRSLAAPSSPPEGDQDSISRAQRARAKRQRAGK